MSLDGFICVPKAKDPSYQGWPVRGDESEATVVDVGKALVLS